MAEQQAWVQAEAEAKRERHNHRFTVLRGYTLNQCYDLGLTATMTCCGMTQAVTRPTPGDPYCSG